MRRICGNLFLKIGRSFQTEAISSACRQMNEKTQISNSGKRDAVFLKSGLSVHPSDPGLKRPTLPTTADRTSAACLIPRQSAETCPAGLQHKTGRGVGQSPAAFAVVCSPGVDREDIDRLIAFFQLLDEWERKTNAEEIMQ